MSFMGGGECSSAGNPLSQFAKHTQDDHSLQRDRVVNGGPQGSAGGFRSAGQHGPQDERMNGFMQQNARLPDMPLEGMGHVRMDHAPQGVHMRANASSPAWASEFQQNPQAAMESAFKAPPGTQFSPEDFSKFQQMTNHQAASSSRASPMPSTMGGYQRPMMGMGNMGMGMGYGMSGMYNQQPMYQNQPPMQQADQGKGKGRLVELEDEQWEEQFKQLELQDRQEQEEDQAKAMEPELNQMDEQILESETDHFGDFESIWKGIQAEKAAAKENMDEEEWVDQFENHDWANTMNWDGLGSSARLLGDPSVEDYLFEDDNLFKDTPNPFEEGLRIVDEGGNLSLAALAFEAAVQKDPSHVEAWVQLGTAQAQNEKETAAIRALEQAKRLDPNNAPALMTLAVSYTNEGYDSTAYRTLERWLSVRYPSIIAPADLSPVDELGFTERQQLHDKVTQHFINAARLSPDGEHMDPDVQVGLGVLFYGAEEYEKAVDCFSSALESSELGASNKRSQIHLLWNRLGATLANSGKSEDAIAAYEKALTLRPNFVRARYNLGVSCINMGCHGEAAGHLLAALAMHKTVEKEGREKARELLGGDVSDAQLDAMTTQNRSTNLYDTLRRVFMQMGRRDLSEKVVAGVDPEIFRGEVEF